MSLFPDDPDELCTPGDVIRAILADDYTLTNREIALMAHVKVVQVESVRRSMIYLGVIPPKRVFQATVEPRIGYKPLPPAPRSLPQGACVGVLPSPHVSDDWHDRQRAIEICRTCHVLVACREWSLSLPTKDTAIYGGLTAMGRDKLRRKRAGRPPPPAQINANVTRNRRVAERRAREAAEAEAARQAQEGAA